jgi:hypothetical protein
MPGKPPEPAAPVHSAGGEPEGERRDRGADERVGPVAIARHRKDDGRALILYTRVEPPPR